MILSADAANRVKVYILLLLMSLKYLLRRQWRRERLRRKTDGIYNMNSYQCQGNRKHRRPVKYGDISISCVFYSRQDHAGVYKPERVPSGIYENLLCNTASRNIYIKDIESQDIHIAIEAPEKRASLLNSNLSFFIAGLNPTLQVSLCIRF